MPPFQIFLMRVLLLTPMPPSPHGLQATPVLLHGLLSAVRERHEVTLVTVAGPHPQDIEAADALRASGLEVHAVPRVEATRWARARRWVDHTARWALGHLPMRTIWFHRPEVQETIDRLVAERAFDLVHVEDNAMGVYRLPPGIPTLFGEHEVRTPRPVRWTEWLHDDEGAYRGLLDEIDWHRWANYQRTVWRRFDLIQVLTERDARTMERIDPELVGRVRVNPFAVEIPPLADSALEEDGTIVFTGGFLHSPNVEAARWLAGEIMTRLRTLHPGVRLRLVGNDPRGSLRDLAASDVEVVGWVPSMHAELARAAVVVAPLRTGGGQRMKVLEAMASGKAVVTTARGATGLLRREGAPLPIAVAETAEEIATQTAALLRDTARRRALGASARELVAAQHGIEAYAARTEEAYTELLTRTSRSA
ncbi:MAG TPA: glycosyltransferase family 4 protein [Gemmatimonadaceae bacterium]